MPAFPEDPNVRCMLALKAGRREALDELVQSNAPRLLAFLRHYAGTQEDAEDIAQLTFASVWEARNNYQPVARFSTWLYRIAVNHAINHKRREKLRRSGELVDGLVCDWRADAPDHMVRAEAAARVRAAVDALSPQQRSIILLRCYEGFSMNELCVALELGLAAVKSLLFRARQNLKADLEADIEAVRGLMEPERTRKDLRA